MVSDYQDQYVVHLKEKKTKTIVFFENKRTSFIYCHNCDKVSTALKFPWRSYMLLAVPSPASLGRHGNNLRSCMKRSINFLFSLWILKIRTTFEA